MRYWSTQNILNPNANEGVALLDQLKTEANTKNVEIRTHSFKNSSLKGLYFDGVITINSNAISSTAEMTCIIAEELGHHETSAGNILDQKSIQNRKQELRARQWAYTRLIPLGKIIDVYKARIKGRYEIAEYLGVTEEFLQASIDRYKERYGIFKKVDTYIIIFDPLGVIEIFD